MAQLRTIAKTPIISNSRNQKWYLNLHLSAKLDLNARLRSSYARTYGDVGREVVDCITDVRRYEMTP